jgi:hypothetical protein
MRIRPVEVLLIEVIIYLGLWLWDDYLATMLSIVMGGIFLLILVVSFVVEWIERSNVPRWYFYFMIASVLAPVLAAALYILIGGGLSWLS